MFFILLQGGRKSNCLEKNMSSVHEVSSFLHIKHGAEKRKPTCRKKKKKLYKILNVES